MTGNDLITSGDEIGSISVERDGGVLIGRIDGGPHAMVVPGVVRDLTALVDQAATDDTVDAVVLTGTLEGRWISHADVEWLYKGAATSTLGGRSVAGAAVAAADLARRTRMPGLKHTPLKGAIELDHFHDVLRRMNDSGVIFVAALNGSAMGGGCELALACDFRVMADGPFLIGQPEILLGTIPGGGGTQRLPRLVGQQRGLTLILEGRCVAPEEALAIGLVDEVVDPDQLMDTALERARYFGARDKIAIGAAKRSVYRGVSAELDAGLQLERAEFIDSLSSPHAQQVSSTYVARTASSGELPLYDPTIYAESLRTGSLPSS